LERTTTGGNTLPKSLSDDDDDIEPDPIEMKSNDTYVKSIPGAASREETRVVVRPGRPSKAAG